VIQVKAKDKPSHLVAVVKGILSKTSAECYETNQLETVPEAEERNDLTSPWFLFNDFVVNNISEDEALSFPGQWKVSTRHRM
jgi:PAB-dependent poly(A)-specific ribonuclease subunit 2